ncbi:MAG: type III-A CRISPR-associated RAMP protein Csm5 [Planctomycetes bacterium]|nr:type III-A CRISPR-associated RAMP protein Csm5 [Planctomycetota bacterium]
MTTERWNLDIQFLSPVHVGAGITIEPYEYDIIEQDGNFFLLVLDQNKMFSSMNDSQRKEFDTLLDGDHVNHTIVSNWMKQQFKATEYMKFAISIQESIGNQLKKNMSNEQSRGAIELLTRNPNTGAPYLPGSSIKGSIRTALLSSALGNPITRELAGISADRSDQDLQSSAFGYKKNGKTSLSHDPFRQLSVGDADIHPDDCFIHKIEMIRNPKSKKGDDASGIKICRDMVHGIVSLGEHDPPPICTSAVSFQFGLLDISIMREETLKQKITPDSIIRSCNDFYIPNAREELAKFGEIILSSAKESILNQLDSLQKNQCLIRLGRHSHFENMVMTHHPKMREPEKGYGETRSYAGGKVPMGWAICSWSEKE